MIVFIRCLRSVYASFERPCINSTGIIMQLAQYIYAHCPLSVPIVRSDTETRIYESPHIFSYFGQYEL